MHPLEHEIQAVSDAYSQGSITEEEMNYLLSEIRDVKAAEQCAGNEEMFRYVVQACNVAMGLV
jgi:predicted metal-dependent peptidase